MVVAAPGQQERQERPHRELAGQRQRRPPRVRPHRHQRPRAQKVLGALLDKDRLETEALVRRTRIDVAELGGEIRSLQEQGIVRESTQPGPFFGRPHRRVFSLSEEGYRQIVEIHRNHSFREDE